MYLRILRSKKDGSLEFKFLKNFDTMLLEINQMNGEGFTLKRNAFGSNQLYFDALKKSTYTLIKIDEKTIFTTYTSITYKEIEEIKFEEIIK